MPIHQQILNYLSQLISQGPKSVDAIVLDSMSEQGYIVGVPVDTAGIGISIALTDYDRYSIALQRLEVVSQTSISAAELQSIAARIVETITYLEEPLTFLELDLDQKVAQLRSQSPSPLFDDGSDSSVSEEGVAYWEVRLWAGPTLNVDIVRYQWAPPERHRQIVAHPITLNTLARLADDFVSILAGATETDKIST